MNLLGSIRRTPARRRVGIAATMALFTMRLPVYAAPTPGTPNAPREHLVELKREILAADYGADLPTLGRLRDAASTLHRDAEWGYLALYWSGFASWRSALNGANVGMERDALRAHLEAAAMDLEASIDLRPDFADSQAASASVHGWLGRFLRDEPERFSKAAAIYFLRTRRALRLAPDNPRALWVDASIDLFLPRELGADRDEAMRTYRRMLEVAGEPDPTDPFPDWGAPEAHMSLAFAALQSSPPDLATARVEAGAALALVPGWSYVRDVLRRQIEAAATAEPGGPD